MAEKKKKRKKVKLQKAKLSDSERKQNFLARSKWERDYQARRSRLSARDEGYIPFEGSDRAVRDVREFYSSPEGRSLLHAKIGA